MEPNWNHLPHRPREFFELAPDAELRDLKRAYGRLIKRFKPDTHPTEFMRIRAAYEEVESAIAYGFTDAQVAPTPVVVETEPVAPEEACAPPEDSPPSQRRKPKLNFGKPPVATPAKDLYAQRLLTFSRDGGGADLPPDLKPHTAENFIHLAFYLETLSDENGGEAQFLQTLIEGLKAFPHHRALHQCLRHFFEGLTDPERIRHWLNQSRWWLPPAAYFYLTEDAWFTLGELEGGEAVADLLQDITRDTPVTASQVTFLKRFLKRHHHRVNSVWFEQCLVDIQDFHDHAEDTGESDGYNDELEFLNALLQFVRLTPAAFERYPVYHEIGRLLRLVYGPDGNQHSAQVYRFFQRLASLEYTCNNFSGPTRDLWLPYQLLDGVLMQFEDIFNTTDHDRREAGMNPTNLTNLGLKIQDKLNTESTATKREDGWRFLYFMGAGLIAFAVFVQVIGDILGPHAVLRLIAGIPIAGAVCVFGFTFFVQTFSPNSNRYQAMADWQTYELIVRPVLIDHLKTFQLTYGNLYAAARHEKASTWINQRRAWVSEFLLQDMPLAFHSLGLRVMMN